jgi:hypothetical protein
MLLEVGRNGCQNDGLDEAGTMARNAGGGEGREEGGREGHKIGRAHV